MDIYFGELWMARLLLQKGMALIYLMAFISAYNQFPALLGEHGLLPVPDHLRGVAFAMRPSIFHWYYSDRFFKAVAICGILLSLVLLFGLIDALLLSILAWLVLWGLYLSIVNVGQIFYAFGWESMLLEAGFITAFLGTPQVAPPLIPILILRWMLFRTEVGAGLIKLRHDPCWRDLTCLYYHYETQPLPNPLSWFFHHLPKSLHRFSVAFSHFVQLVVPFGLFAPQPVASIAGSLIIAHQLLLIVSGNYSWLNWLTVVLGFSALSDRYVLPSAFAVSGGVAPLWYEALLYLFASAVVLLSVKPVMNLFSKDQLMNFSYNPLHLINTYGAFGAITRKRYEIIIEGTADSEITADTVWREYEWKGKPGPIRRCPPIIAPYHLRLDWLMWFLPLNVHVANDAIAHSGYEVWFIRFMKKLLKNDPAMTSLLRRNPFIESRPSHVRARFFHYRYTTAKDLLETKAFWRREYIADYLPPISLEGFEHDLSRK